MKGLIEEFFKKKNFFICTPRLYSFGGSIESLGEFLKISKYFQFKMIICAPLFNLHKKHKKKKIFALSIVLDIFSKMSWDEKILTILLSIYLNCSLFFNFLKIRGLLQKIFGDVFVNKYLPLTIGYNGLSNNDYFDCNSKTWKNILNEKINYSKGKTVNKKYSEKKKYISVYIKDKNYSEISEISLDAVSKIENFRASFEYMIDSGFEIIRLGDNLSENFQFENNSFKDLTNSKNYTQNKQYSTYANSEFYFGSNTPGVLMAIFFDKKRIIANAPAQYSNNTLSLSKCNFSIFKKVFSIKEKRILSIEEILNNENLFVDEISLLKRSKDFLLIENTPDEILETCKAFLNYNYKNIKEDEILLNQYLKQRSAAVENLFKKSSPLTKSSLMKKYRYSEVNIPNYFLKKYLYDSKELIEESKIIKKNLNF